MVQKGALILARPSRKGILAVYWTSHEDMGTI
jgi:hypothetical protein